MIGEEKRSEDSDMSSHDSWCTSEEESQNANTKLAPIESIDSNQDVKKTSWRNFAEDSDRQNGNNLIIGEPITTSESMGLTDEEEKEQILKDDARSYATKMSRIQSVLGRGIKFSKGIALERKLSLLDVPISRKSLSNFKVPTDVD